MMLSMRMRIFDRLMTLNAWVACTFAIFSAISLFNAPDRLLTTPRHEFVFDEILNRQGFAIIYFVIALVASVGIVHTSIRWVGFVLVALVSLFWSGIAIIPTLFNAVPQGSLLGAISGVTLTLYGATIALLCYERYNRRPATPVATAAVEDGIV